MVDNNQAVVYSEVYEILNLLGKQYIDLIPNNLYKFFEENRLNSYSPSYDINNPLTNQKINKKTAAILCMLHYNYWCKDDNEKEKISRILEYNKKNKEEKYAKLTEDIFAKRNNNIKNANVNNKEDSLVIVKEDNLFKKIIRFLKRIFKR